eukprot:COSAG01_NODE_1062_length_11889_cov_62.593469_6_plen_51_part_00
MLCGIVEHKWMLSGYVKWMSPAATDSASACHQSLFSLEGMRFIINGPRKL